MVFLIDICKLGKTYEKLNPIRPRLSGESWALSTKDPSLWFELNSVIFWRFICFNYLVKILIQIVNVSFLILFSSMTFLTFLSLSSKQIFVRVNATYLFCFFTFILCARSILHNLRCCKCDAIIYCVLSKALLFSTRQ